MDISGRPEVRGWIWFAIQKSVKLERGDWLSIPDSNKALLATGAKLVADVRKASWRLKCQCLPASSPAKKKTKDEKQGEGKDLYISPNLQGPISGACP
ncbi:unnamed protein product [Bursaphelenchus xylophilus]|uniref:(pine wood nematode) hypothetical protein n=1 Tax=Bursaphelenchus xylophilus TaxID=6326 RepID=A0A1I7RRL9_BURXY|nr:unnamed protein product [Bursaphelenchus xylophilus]CAG9123657.1 unnamed protein product [Bursaphelenchus xylophilus]